jgi:hypothetical protein
MQEIRQIQGIDALALFEAEVPDVKKTSSPPRYLPEGSEEEKEAADANDLRREKRREKWLIANTNIVDPNIANTNIANTNLANTNPPHQNVNDPDDSKYNSAGSEDEAAALNFSATTVNLAGENRMALKLWNLFPHQHENPFGLMYYISMRGWGKFLLVRKYYN